jgi:Asp-tRNA(Asn)/Glu-tRNA(Gln) amidotransferase A subunit family amidase
VGNHVRAEVTRLLERFDVIATPTAGAGAPVAEGLDFASALMLPVFTGAWNVLGLPAISVPCGFSQQGLPVGLQIVGRHHDDFGVLQLAHAFEQRTRFWQARPPSAA